MNKNVFSGVGNDYSLFFSSKLQESTTISEFGNQPEIKESEKIFYRSPLILIQDMQALVHTQEIN